jgi:hypothetical protein
MSSNKSSFGREDGPPNKLKRKAIEKSEGLEGIDSQQNVMTADGVQDVAGINKTFSCHLLKIASHEGDCSDVVGCVC